MKVAITGTGAALPERRLTNQDLEKWLTPAMNGLLPEPVSGSAAFEKGLSNLDLSEAAAVIARERRPEGAELDLILVATVTPDHLFPPLPASCRRVWALTVQRLLISPPAPRDKSTPLPWATSLF